MTRAHLASDIYFSSANALTERGEIYVVDGSNNRLGALLWGPEKVYVIVGQNKIVRNLSEAVNRVKRLAAPANAVRLSKDTHCSKTGVCIAPKISEDNLMAIPAGHLRRRDLFLLSRPGASEHTSEDSCHHCGRVISGTR